MRGASADFAIFGIGDKPKTPVQILAQVRKRRRVDLPIDREVIVSIQQKLEAGNFGGRNRIAPARARSPVENRRGRLGRKGGRRLFLGLGGQLRVFSRRPLAERHAEATHSESANEDSPESLRPAATDGLR